MPALPPPALILVSGASGFLGAHVVKALLARGYFVRGTVRTASKGDYLKKLFEVDWPSKFEYVVVEDIAFAGAFDDALEGVDGVVHTASPVFAGPDDPPEALITPAVNGTICLLHSIQSHGYVALDAHGLSLECACRPRVQRVVLTSSFAAMIEPRQGYYEYSEADWNEYSLREVETQGAAAGLHKYRAAKVLAERAFWDFLAKQEPKFDGVAINPPWIFGPVLHEVDAMERLNYSTKTLWDLLANEVPESSLATYVGNYVDVRDAAEVHVDAIEREDLAGRRLVFGCGAIAVQDFYDAANTKGPENLPPLPFAIPLGRPGIADDVRASFVQLSPASARLLGREYKFRKLPEIVRDTLHSIVDRGLCNV